MTVIKILGSLIIPGDSVARDQFFKNLLETIGSNEEECPFGDDIRYLMIHEQGKTEDEIYDIYADVFDSMFIKFIPNDLREYIKKPYGGSIVIKGSNAHF